MQKSQAHHMPTSLKPCIFLIIPKLWHCLFQAILLVYLCMVYECLPLLLPTFFFFLTKVFSRNQKLSFSNRLTDQGVPSVCLSPPISIRVSINGTKHHDQNKLGEEMIVFRLQISGHIPTVREV